jgi:hypothetical protein
MKDLGDLDLELIFDLELTDFVVPSDFIWPT